MVDHIHVEQAGVGTDAIAAAHGRVCVHPTISIRRPTDSFVGHETIKYLVAACLILGATSTNATIFNDQTNFLNAL